MTRGDRIWLGILLATEGVFILASGIVLLAQWACIAAVPYVLWKDVSAGWTSCSAGVPAFIAAICWCAKMMLLEAAGEYRRLGERETKAAWRRAIAAGAR